MLLSQTLPFARMPQRVVRSIAITPAPTFDALAYCLDCWKDSMQKDDRDMGAKGMRLMSGDGDGYGSDNGQTRRDAEIAEATGAMIDSLSAAHRWCIYRSCSISTVWRYPNLDYITTLQDARKALENKLRINVASRTLF